MWAKISKYQLVPYRGVVINEFVAQTITVLVSSILIEIAFSCVKQNLGVR